MTAIALSAESALPRRTTIRRFAPLILSLAGLGLLGVAAHNARLELAPLVILNETPSLAQGLYARTPAARLSVGQIVALPLEGPARTYLADTLGYPASTWLLKRVAALPRDPVCRTGNTLMTGTRSVRIAHADAAGRPLPRWEGCRTLGPDEVFLLGDDPRSFDSRYFGPVALAAVRAPYTEILTWSDR